MGVGKRRNTKKLLILFIFSLLFIAFLFVKSQPKKKNYNMAENKQINSTPTITISPTSTLTPTISPTPTLKLQTNRYFVTFYGWPDNTPSGNAIAFPKSRSPRAKHETAGGTGTYNNPITFASDPAKIPIGTIFYVPYLKKYIIMEDLCTGCIENWNSGVRHLDIWMDSNDQFAEELLQCQGKWTRREIEIALRPPKDLPVTTAPLFNKVNGTCLK